MHSRFPLTLCLVASFHVLGLAASAQSQTLTVTWPNGGETLTAGTIETITWTTDVTTNSYVDLSLHQGGAYLTEIARVPLDDGSLEWVVCDQVGNGSDFTILVATSVQGQPVEDESDAPFTITGGTPPPILTVISPNGGESLAAGSTQTVSWTTISTNGYVDAWLYADGVLDTFLGSAPTGAGHIDWRVSKHLEPGPAYTVRLNWLSSCGPIVEDTSDAPFSLSDGAPIPIITVTNPNGGELWLADTMQTITWSSTDSVGNVEVWVVEEDAFYTYLGSSPMSAGFLDWSIPPCEGNRDDRSVLVRWSDGTRSTEDTSDSHFATTNGFDPALSVTYPAGGETFIPGSAQIITWTSTATNGFVEAELWRSGYSKQQIGRVPLSAGAMIWAVCGEASASNEFTIRLRMTECGISAESASFAIGAAGTPSLQMLSPLTGATWTAGQPQTIAWQSENVAGNVDIYLPDHVDKHYGYASVPIDAGSYTWVVPATLPPGEYYRVKIRAVGCGQTLIASANVSIQQAAAIQGDADGDGDLDLGDLARFQHCFTDDTDLLMPPCDHFDLEPDADIDLRDYWRLIYGLSGPGDSPPSKDTFGLADLIAFEQCLAGPSALPLPPWPIYLEDCRERFDHDADGDLDLADFVDFQRRFDASTNP